MPKETEKLNGRDLNMTLLRRLYILFLAAPIMLVVIVFCSVLEAIEVLLSELRDNTIHTINKFKENW
jgi:hypothetical protein